MNNVENLNEVLQQAKYMADSLDAILDTPFRALNTANPEMNWKFAEHAVSDFRKALAKLELAKP